MQSKGVRQAFDLLFTLYFLHIDFDRFVLASCVLHLGVGCLHWLAAKRVSYLFTENSPKTSLYVRIVLLLPLLAAGDLVLSSHSSASSVLALFFYYEYLLYFIDALKTLCTFLLHAYSRYQPDWLGLGDWLSCLEFVGDLASLVVKVLELVQLIAFNQFYLIYFMDNILHKCTKLYQHVTSFLTSRALLREVEQFPTSEPDNAEEKCTLCLRVLVQAKKLNCGHLFHAQCLREYFQSNPRPICPTCTRPIIAPPAEVQHSSPELPVIAIDAIQANSMPSEPLEVGALSWGLPCLATDKVRMEVEVRRQEAEAMNEYLLKFYKHPPPAW
jgi:E3 ubiquitin-protein ligase synoviolin